MSPHVRESGIQHFSPLESGILGLGIRNLVPGIRNPTRGIRNPTSSITTESQSGMYYTVSSNCTTNHSLPPPLCVPYHHHHHHHHHHQKVFGHLTPSLLRLGSFWFLTGHMFSMLKIIFCHVVFLNFSDLDPHCLLNGQHRSQLFPFMRCFTSSYM